MSQPEHYQMLVLGSGEGGKYLAWHMARSGHRTAVVERKLIGGSCPNTNCLPSKNEIWSAKVADLVHHADRFGIMTGHIATDMKGVLARKRAMVDGLIAMHLDHYKASGAELIMGTGRFIAAKSLKVSLNDGGSRILTGDHVFLNLGTHATIPDISGLAAAAPLTNIEALELDRLPDHLVVIGGGYVGLELAQAYRRFGSRVTIIEAGPHLAAREDADVAAALEEMLRDEGIAVHLSAKLLGVQGRSGQAVTCSCIRLSALRQSPAAISWWRPGAPPTRTGSGSTSPVSRSMPADISSSTTDWKRVRRMSGRSANVREARSSRMSRSTISGSSGTISPAVTAALATGWSLTACSPTLRWHASA
jgi:pyruvate/2-oxoglutarate dehydrogenase complex dihydrolipoamide dehydrogenase (E3) component